MAFDLGSSAKIDSSVNDRMAKARAARAEKLRGSKLAPQSIKIGEFTITRLPETEAQQRVYLTLCALSVDQQYGDGYLDKASGETRHSPVIAGWKLLEALRGVDYGEPFHMLMARLEVSGFVRRVLASFVPDITDQPKTGGARSTKGARSADIRRAVDSYLAGVHGKVDGDKAA